MSCRVNIFCPILVDSAITRLELNNSKIQPISWTTRYVDAIGSNICRRALNRVRESLRILQTSRGMVGGRATRFPRETPKRSGQSSASQFRGSMEDSSNIRKMVGCNCANCVTARCHPLPPSTLARSGLSTFSLESVSNHRLLHLLESWSCRPDVIDGRSSMINLTKG